MGDSVSYRTVSTGCVCRVIIFFYEMSGDEKLQNSREEADKTLRNLRNIASAVSIAMVPATCISRCTS